MSEVIGQCSCGGDIVETEKTYRCKECGKYVFKSIFWKKISKDDAVKLINGERVFIKIPTIFPALTNNITPPP